MSFRRLEDNKSIHCSISSSLPPPPVSHLLSHKLFFFFSCPTSELSEQFPRELYSDICLEPQTHPRSHRTPVHCSCERRVEGVRSKAANSCLMDDRRIQTELLKGYEVLRFNTFLRFTYYLAIVSFLFSTPGRKVAQLRAWLRPARN